jgi:hypothetical protein
VYNLSKSNPFVLHMTMKISLKSQNGNLHQL